MRISDWSSDVCSSDLRTLFADDRPIVVYAPHWQQHRSSWWQWGATAIETVLASGRYNLIFAPHQRLVEKAPEVREAAARIEGLPGVQDRKSVVQGKSVCVRVDLGGRRIIKKKNTANAHDQARRCGSHRRATVTKDYNS